MYNKEFMQFIESLEEYLQEEKVFVPNPKRIQEVEAAHQIAEQLYPNAEITICHDPIQMGALIICIKDMDVLVRGKVEIKLFSEMISKASNFEIYSVGEEEVMFDILFDQSLIRVDM